MTLGENSPLLDFTAVGTSYSFSMGPAASDAVGSVSLWEKALDQLIAIARLEAGWDGAGAGPVRPALVQSAARLLRHLREKGYPPPQDVYPMSDGTITLEWQFPGDVIMRIEVEGVGRGQKMVTYPDAPARFKNVTWPTAARAQWVGAAIVSYGVCRRRAAVDSTRVFPENLHSKDSGLDPFQLAA